MSENLQLRPDLAEGVDESDTVEDMILMRSRMKQFRLLARPEVGDRWQKVHSRAVERCVGTAKDNPKQLYICSCKECCPNNSLEVKIMPRRGEG